MLNKKSIMKAAAAKIRINPLPQHCRQPIRRNLYCRSLVVANPAKTIVIVSCDLLLLGRKWTDKICRKITELNGIPFSDIMICCTHNHSSGIFSFEGFLGDNPHNAYLNEILEPAVLRAVRDAIGNLAPAKTATSSMPFSLFVENSRFLLKDRTIAWTRYATDEIICPTGPVDPQVGVLHIINDNNDTIASLTNYGCHAVTGGDLVSASYPGILCEYVEKRLGGVCLFTAGASGDIHPVQLWNMKDSRTRRSALTRMGKKMADAVTQAVDTMHNYQTDGILECVKENLSLPVREIKEHEKTDILNTMRRKEFENARRESIAKKFSDCKKLLLQHKGQNLLTVIQVIRIGEFNLICIPGEPFVEYGIEIKKRSPLPNTYVATLANDWVGYLPTDQACRLGGYQTWPVFPCLTAEHGSGKTIVKCSLKLLEKCIQPH